MLIAMRMFLATAMQCASLIANGSGDCSGLHKSSISLRARQFVWGVVPCTTVSFFLPHMACYAWITQRYKQHSHMLPSLLPFFERQTCFVNIS